MCTVGEAEKHQSEAFPLTRGTRDQSQCQGTGLTYGVDKGLQITFVPNPGLELARLEGRSCCNTCLLSDVDQPYQLFQPQSPSLENGNNNNPLWVMV